MKQTVLITGSTDGIGLETAKAIYEMGHIVLLHGRNREKLEAAKAALLSTHGEGEVETYLADLSNLADVTRLADNIKATHKQLDVLINNAGVFMTSHSSNHKDIDIRFIVNAIAPYFLTKCLLPIISTTGRVINLSSAAQASIDSTALTTGEHQFTDNAAYAQSKLLLTMWSRSLGLSFSATGPVIVAVNPKSFLGSKMVKEAYGVPGNDIRLGADILIQAAFSEAFAHSHGQYFDNDIGQFSTPHLDALDTAKSQELMTQMDLYINKSISR